MRRTKVIQDDLNPVWNEEFVFPVRDIHTALDLIVYDEDGFGKKDFLGQLAIPLLTVESGERVWYELKERTLSKPSRGAILLQMELYYNPVRNPVCTTDSILKSCLGHGQ